MPPCFGFKKDCFVRVLVEVTGSGLQGSPSVFGLRALLLGCLSSG